MYPVVSTACHLSSDPPTVDFVAVMRHHCELIGKVFGLDRRLHGAVRELALHRNRLEDQPALNETFSAGRFGWRLGRGQALAPDHVPCRSGRRALENSPALPRHGQDDRRSIRLRRRVFMVSSTATVGDRCRR